MYLSVSLYIDCNQVHKERRRGIRFGSMKFLLSNIVALLLVFYLLSLASGKEEKKKDVYIVYMGAAAPASSPETLTQTHLQLLTSVIKRFRFSFLNVLASIKTKLLIHISVYLDDDVELLEFIYIYIY